MKQIIATLSIFLIVFVNACKPGVQGDVGPQGLAGKDGINGTDAPAKGPVGGKGAVGEKGIAGEKGAVGDNVVSNAVASSWTKPNWYFNGTADWGDGNFKRATFYADIDFKEITNDVLQKAVLLTYIRYTNIKNEYTVRPVDTGSYISDIKDETLILTTFQGYSPQTITFYSIGLVSKTASEVSERNSYLARLRAADLESRTIIIFPPKGGRLDTSIFNDYTKTCEAFNINP